MKIIRLWTTTLTLRKDLPCRWNRTHPAISLGVLVHQIHLETSSPLWFYPQLSKCHEAVSRTNKHQPVGYKWHFLWQLRVPGTLKENRYSNQYAQFQGPHLGELLRNRVGGWMISKSGQVIAAVRHLEKVIKQSCPRRHPSADFEEQIFWSLLWNLILLLR